MLNIIKRPPCSNCGILVDESNHEVSNSEEHIVPERILICRINEYKVKDIRELETYVVQNVRYEGLTEVGVTTSSKHIQCIAVGEDRITTVYHNVICILEGSVEFSHCIFGLT